MKENFIYWDGVLFFAIFKWQKDSLDGILGKMDAKAAFETVAQNNTAAPVETDTTAGVRGDRRALIKDDGVLDTSDGEAEVAVNEDVAFEDAELDGAQYSVSKTKQNRPFVIIDRDILENVPQDQWQKTVIENLEKKFPNGIKLHNDQVWVDKQGREEIAYSKQAQWLYDNDSGLLADKLRASDNADEILRSGVGWINEKAKHKRKDDIKDFARAKTLIRVGSNDYEADVLVARLKNEELMLYDIYNLVPTKIEEMDTVKASYSSPNGDRNPADISSDNSISNIGGIVNRGSQIFSRKQKSTPVPKDATAASLGLIDDETFRSGRTYGADVETIRFAQEVAAATGIPVKFFHTPPKNGYIRNGYYY